MYDVDFLPDRIRQQRTRRRYLFRQGYLLAVCAVAMGALAYVRHGRLGKAQAELAALTERAGNLDRQVALIPTMERQMADLLIKKRIDEQLGSPADSTCVLAELCKVMPANIALISLELKTVEARVEPPGPAPRSGSRSAVVVPKKAGDRAEARVRRVRLQIAGLAPTDVDVANFIGQLAASCLFEDVNMGYTKTVPFQGRTAREFQATCYLGR